MPRAGAFALAIFVVVAIFGLTLLAVQWLVGTVAFWKTVHAPWFPVALIIFNSVTLSLVLIIAEVRRKRGEKRAQADEKRLLTASERFQRDVDQGGLRL